MSTKNKPTCLACNREFNSRASVSVHYVQVHNLSRKGYYDTYIRKDDEGICLTCGNETTLYHHGYSKFCSRKCSNRNTGVKETKKETLKNDPTIIENRVKKFKQTLKDNPEIQENINSSIKKWAENNPTKVKHRNKKITKTLKDNPSIVKDRGIKLKQTLKENPLILEGRIEKYKQWCSNNPDKMQQKCAKQSISLRTTYNKMYDKDNNLPYYLYLIKNDIKNIVKIGISNNPKERLKKIIVDFGSSEIVHVIKSTFHKVAPLEIYLHEHFNGYCKIQPTGIGRTEWFDNCILDEAVDLASSYNTTPLLI